MKRTRLLWAAALAVLLAALVLFNLPAAKTTAGESGAPTGSAPGERPADFTLPTVDGGEFTLSAQRGKAVVLNLWATWCTPCVNELPHFDRLQRAYRDDVAVLAIHSDLVTDDVAAYLSGYDYGIAFAIDGDGAVIAALNGSTMLPQTVVLDRAGVVTYNQVGSVTYEALEELVRAALEHAPR